MTPPAGSLLGRGAERPHRHSQSKGRTMFRVDRAAPLRVLPLLLLLVIVMLAAPARALATDQEPANSAAPAPQPETAAPAQLAHVDGFRSAQFGMTEPQVRAAILKDFKLGPDKIKSEQNLAERTQVLTIAVPDVLEGAGTARVSYIFGYASKKLIQINVLWGTAVDPQVAADKVVAAADQLRQLFLESGYDPKTIVSNARLADGEVLVFEGQDADKHATVLRLAAAAEPPRRKNEQPATATRLLLSYIGDAQNPDIYRLKKGEF